MAPFNGEGSDEAISPYVEKTRFVRKSEHGSGLSAVLDYKMNFSEGDHSNMTGIERIRD